MIDQKRIDGRIGRVGVSVSGAADRLERRGTDNIAPPKDRLRPRAIRTVSNRSAGRAARGGRQLIVPLSAILKQNRRAWREGCRIHLGKALPRTLWRQSAVTVAPRRADVIRLSKTLLRRQNRGHPQADRDYRSFRTSHRHILPT